MRAILRKLLPVVFPACLLLCHLPQPCLATEPSIVIDPGHGGGSPLGSQKERTLSSPNNATSPAGLREKDLTLEFSLALEKALLSRAREKGRKIRVILTRREDVNMDFSERARKCAEAAPAAIVSIHFNASEGRKSLGTLCVVRKAALNPNFAADKKFADGLSEACNRGVRKYLPGSASRGSIEDGYLHGGMGSNFFHQLARFEALNPVPKCFLEVEHIDRADVEKALLDRRHETFPAIAGEIAEYLLEFLQ